MFTSLYLKKKQKHTHSIVTLVLLSLIAVSPICKMNTSSKNLHVTTNSIDIMILLHTFNLCHETSDGKGYLETLTIMMKVMIEIETYITVCDSFKIES